MKEFEEFDNILKEYKKQEIFISDQENWKRMIEYVYESNKLEGNQLNLIETTKIITENISIGNKPLKDYLEAKGHYKAIQFAVMASRNKYPLDERILKQLNQNLLSSMWGIDDFYYSWKEKGQKLGEYKVKQNKILYHYEGKEGEIIPESTPENVLKRITEVLKKTNEPKIHLLKKIAYLSYQIFINQPFPDGNKRTARMLCTFLSMKEGMPLMVFNIQEKTNFNSALLETFLMKDQNILINFLCKEYSTVLYQMIEKDKKLKRGKNKGFSFVI